ncbi:FAD-dependent oxidoreductase [Desulfurispira natronophila]|uniref:dihydrouracil dehydrogenase (NAD(+)) n=1 Tax=Desulfurispira natronophila TaxID=682562 RepID=A0A7W8DHI3_9BACT|nr:FAD-dependent oxidoreductase [Desulfurispira natronophila]MBB5022469.1 NADPH-dependent glutamate synthase beta subunit-like oxidoreductase/glutamate synthase domain-containing protein 3/ferredoxin [Desulfurispira natronophila]
MSQPNTRRAQIEGIVDSKRISTQQLLQQVYEELERGCREFHINASGQYNIGGPLWAAENEPITFHVRNPGQRLGSMGMSGTTIVVEGSAPADVGWLNAGAEIIVKGDSGDTTAHCAATGNIYVGGRVGTRSGALMKYDPKFSPPQFWVLESAGSFSFEFMGGGIGVVCGYGCENLDSVLGHRSCVGMVGGTVYVRGPLSDLSDDIWVLELDQGDRDFLQEGLQAFTRNIERPEVLSELSDFGQWKKIVAKTYEERSTRSLMPIAEFRQHHWVEGGIFGALYDDDYYVADFVERGQMRMREPQWLNAAFSAPCEHSCPTGIPTQKRISLLRQQRVEEALQMILDYSPFPASVCGQVCPNVCIDECNRRDVDIPVRVDQLGLLSQTIAAPLPTAQLEQRIAIIGSGVGGLTAAWHLRRQGYQVDIYEKDSDIGGKLRQVIPAQRLNQDILKAELERIKTMGIGLNLNSEVNRVLFSELESKYDAVVVAVGAHNPVVIPFEGHERLVKGLDFLKQINRSDRPQLGKRVVVIGAGNAAMDVVIGAYECGAEEVTAIDIQKPAAFDHEIAHAKALGAQIRWPVFTEKVTAEGVVLKGGELLPADTVIISVGDRPDFSFVPDEWLDEKGFIESNEFWQVRRSEKTFVLGDAIVPGLFTHAIGDGRKVAMNIGHYLQKQPLDDFSGAPVIPSDRVRDEYYHPMNPQRVQEQEAQQEVDRCMSCGYCRDCHFCEDICPEQAIERREHADGNFEYVSMPERCIGCGICAGVCPCGIWSMEDQLEKYIEA